MKKAAVILLTAVAAGSLYASCERDQQVDAYKLEAIEVFGTKHAAENMRFELFSNENERLDEFLDRAWPRLREYMDVAGLNSCLVVGRDDNGRFFSYIEASHSEVAVCRDHEPSDKSNGEVFNGRVRKMRRADVEAAETFLGRMLRGNDIAAILGDANQEQNKAISIRIGGNTFPATKLAEVHGEPVISMDDFAMRVASGLADYSATTGTEACAMFCRKLDGAWAAIPLSIGSHVACPITNYCPEGSLALGVGIHSHPAGHQYKINEADKVVLVGPFYRVGDTEKRGKSNEFSDEDYAAGPGYMVSSSRDLFYQAGRYKVRRLGRLK